MALTICGECAVKSGANAPKSAALALRTAGSGGGGAGSAAFGVHGHPRGGSVSPFTLHPSPSPSPSSSTEFEWGLSEVQKQNSKKTKGASSFTRASNCGQFSSTCARICGERWSQLLWSKLYFFHKWIRFRIPPCVTVGVRGHPAVRPISRTATPDLDRRVYKTTCWSSICAGRHARVRIQMVTRCQTSDDPKANAMTVVQVLTDNRICNSGRLGRHTLQYLPCAISAFTDKQVCKIH